MKNQVINGYAYSYITKVGTERLVMASFGISKTRAKQHLEYYNQGKAEQHRVKPHKRYEIQIKVLRDVDELNALVDLVKE